MRRLLLSVLAIVGLSTVNAAEAGQLVVVESTVAGNSSGQIIDGAKSLDIGAGKSVTVITGKRQSEEVGWPVLRPANRQGRGRRRTRHRRVAVAPHRRQGGRWRHPRCDAEFEAQRTARGLGYRRLPLGHPLHRRRQPGPSVAGQGEEKGDAADQDFALRQEGGDQLGRGHGLHRLAGCGRDQGRRRIPDAPG